MIKKLIFTAICIFLSPLLFGQTNVSGIVYGDSDKNSTISKVKIVVKSKDCRKTYRSDQNGSFDFFIPDTSSDYSIKLSKRGFIPVIINFSFTDTEPNYIFEILLNPKLSPHDEGYQGSSKVLSINNR